LDLEYHWGTGGGPFWKKFCVLPKGGGGGGSFGGEGTAAIGEGHLLRKEKDTTHEKERKKSAFGESIKKKKASTKMKFMEGGRAHITKKTIPKTRKKESTNGGIRSNEWEEKGGEREKALLR